MTRVRTIAAAMLLLGAVGRAEAQSTNHLACVVHDAPEEGRLVTCTGRVSPRLPEWRFELRGHPPNIVNRIEIYETGRETPRQVLDGFDLRPRLVARDGASNGQADFILQDVNFDRLNDLRIAVGPPDADGTAYRWFLFDKEANEFVSTDALDALRDPIFNTGRKLVMGAFKDDRGRTGRIVYKWREGALEPVGALARERTDDGRCIASHYVMRDGKFEKRNETECRPSDEPAADQ